MLIRRDKAQNSTYDMTNLLLPSVASLLSPSVGWSPDIMYIASIYIIFIIATLELQQDVLNSTAAAIKSIATALWEPPSGKWFCLVQ